MIIPNVEWSVDDPTTKQEHCFITSTEATDFALEVGARTIDLLCWDRKAAKAMGFLEEFDQDPDHSVTCRYKINDLGVVTDVIGMIP